MAWPTFSNEAIRAAEKTKEFKEWAAETQAALEKLEWISTDSSFLPQATKMADHYLNGESPKEIVDWYVRTGQAKRT